MTPKQADKLIQEFKDLGEQMQKLKERRAKIVAQFEGGRTEGEQLAIYIQGRGWRSRFDAARLKMYVPARTLDLCRVTTHFNGSAKVVPKLKPKAKKEK